VKAKPDPPYPAASACAHSRAQARSSRYVSRYSRCACLPGHHPRGPGRGRGAPQPARRFPGHHRRGADVHTPVGQAGERGGDRPGRQFGRGGVRCLGQHDQFGRQEPLTGQASRQGGRRGGVGGAGQHPDPAPGDHVVAEPGQLGQGRQPGRRRLRGEDLPQHRQCLGRRPRRAGRELGDPFPQRRGVVDDRNAARGRLAADHDHAGTAGQLLACLVRGRRDEQGVLPVQVRKAVPGHRSGHPDRSGPGVRGDRVQQGPHRRGLARIPRTCVDRVAGPGPGPPDRVEPGQLHAEPVVGYRVAAGGDPVETGCQVRRDVPDEDHRLAQRPGRRDQPPEPPAAVGRSRITRVGPGRAGQHGLGLDEHQVGARALQHHVRVVRQQREHGRVRGERGAGPRGEHPGDDQTRRDPAGCRGARRAEAGRGQRGQEAFTAAGQVAELR
jgi:hypothetical protein